MKTMKVAHLTNMFPLSPEMHYGHAVRNLIDALEDVGDEDHRVYYFLPYGARVFGVFSKRNRLRGAALKDGPWREGLCYRRRFGLPREALAEWVNPVWQAFAARAFAEETGYDLIHVHTLKDLCLLARGAAKRRNVPYVLTLRREVGLWHRFPQRRRNHLRTAIMDAEALIAPSGWISERCKELFGREAVVIPHGTPGCFNEPADTTAIEDRKIIFAGELTENKGVLVLLRAVKEILAKREAVKLVIAGSGPLEGVIREETEGIAEISFLGQVQSASLLTEMRKARILCVPSYSETFGVVYAEAMKQGLMVIGREGTGIAGTGERGVHFELIDRDEDLAPLLATLLADPERVKKIAHAGQELAREWTWERSAQKHLDVYRSALDSRGR